MNKIELQYVTFEQSKLLKEKGFNEKCNYNYYDYPEGLEMQYGSGKYWACEEGLELQPAETLLLKSPLPYRKHIIYKEFKAPEIWQVVEWIFKYYKYSIEAELNIPQSGEHDGCYVFNGVIKISQDYKLKIFYTSRNQPTREKAYLKAIEYTLKELI